MMILQRLASGSTLCAIVKDFIANRPAFYPENRRLSEGMLSKSSGAYAGARSRVDLETVHYFDQQVLDSFTERPGPLQFRPRQTFLLDDTTITLAPTDDLRKARPIQIITPKNHNSNDVARLQVDEIGYSPFS